MNFSTLKSRLWAFATDRGTLMLARIVVIFAAVAGGLGAFIWLWGGPFLGFLTTTNTIQTSSILNSIGFTNTIQDLVNIVLPERTLRIVVECTAIYIMIVYIALVVAYPFRWRIKVLWLPMGLVIIYLANLARLVFVGVLSRYASPAMFTIIHDILFQVAMVIVVLVMWIIMLGIQRGGLNRRIMLYAACVSVACVVLELGAIWISRRVEWMPTSFTSYIVPALGIIWCAFGEGWKRKLVWSVGAVALYVAEGMLLINSGLLQNVNSASPFMTGVTAALYVIAYLAIPLGAIILFIGRKPARLWGEDIIEILSESTNPDDTLNLE